MSICVSQWLVLLTTPAITYSTAANSHGPLAVLRHLKRDDIEIINAYGKTRSPEFLAMNPCHTCPTIELDGDNGAIWESCAIMRYLCVNSDGGDDLYPSDATLRGKVRTALLLRLSLWLNLPCFCEKSRSYTNIIFLCESINVISNIRPLLVSKIDMVMDWRQTSMYPCIPSIAYIVFAMEQDDEQAKKDFKKLLDEHFPTLLNVFMKDTKFCYSDKPTIADLAIAPSLTFLKARKKFWQMVPEEIKDYHKRVLEAFPDTKENFDMLDGMCVGCDFKGHDLEP